MKAKDLIAELSVNPEMEVMVLDSFNGGGFPRDLNFGPIVKKITTKDAEECGDCECRVGEKVFLIGYGCY